MNEKLRDTNNKLHLYCLIKNDYRCEDYLNITHNCLTTVIRFRLSLHWLPIERGRYSKPAIPRDDRICTFCDSNKIGNEIHCLLVCEGDKFKSLRDSYLPKLISINLVLNNMGNKQLMHMMEGVDIGTTKIVAQWVYNCNTLFDPR